MNKFLILKDYRDHFYSSTTSRGASMNLDKVARGLEALGNEVTIKNFAELNFAAESYSGVRVIYQSAEDPSLFYKDYIEDVLLGLVMQGAVLIPDFNKFRAHHNKVFMEILRDLTPKLPRTGVSSRGFGTFEEYRRYFHYAGLPIVLKGSEGSKSRRVRLAKSRSEMDASAKSLSSTPTAINVYWYLKNLWDHKGFSHTSSHRKKFIVQPYVSNLTGDYKIVIYAAKYFVLRRENRPNDFRASGSGRLCFPEMVDERILNFAKITKECFNTPFMSIDVCFNGEQCYLLEFQFVSFGQYAVDGSSWNFRYVDTGWRRVEEKTTAEDEFIIAIDEFAKS